MKHGQFAKGFRSMNKLRAHPIIAARDYYYSNIIYAEELRVAGDSTYYPTYPSLELCRLDRHAGSTDVWKYDSLPDSYLIQKKLISHS
jgi:hypothetical protein